MILGHMWENKYKPDLIRDCICFKAPLMLMMRRGFALNYVV